MSQRPPKYDLLTDGRVAKLKAKFDKPGTSASQHPSAARGSVAKKAQKITREDLQDAKSLQHLLSTGALDELISKAHADLLREYFSEVEVNTAAIKDERLGIKSPSSAELKDLEGFMTSALKNPANEKAII